MRITLDHNVIIDFVNSSPRVDGLRAAIVAGKFTPYVTEIGASEMRRFGVRPDRYDLFESLLREAGLESAERLTPLATFDVTFWDHGLWSDEGLDAEADGIEAVLFGGSKPLPLPTNLEDPASAAWLNRHCDVQALWCHIRSGNDVFVTSDRNFLKDTKLSRLLALGARRICLPEDLDF
jgi:hypothetical protein